MKTICKFFWFSVIYLLFIRSPISSQSLESYKLSDKDYTALKVSEAVLQLFKLFPDSVWPGYDLAQEPFIFYMPGEWALLFNYPKVIEGFTSYPADWPDLETDILFYSGQYKELAGQLAFDFPVDTLRVAAIPYMGKSEVENFAMIIHEGFHQYQGRAFGEIPWEREEKYPIQDSQNTALAYLEMRLLMDALQSAYADKRELALESIKKFVAVRDYRWKHSDSFVAKYEQGQEINEGTAKYVEAKSIDLVRQTRYSSSLSGLTSPLLEDFSSISMPQYLLEDFQKRMTGNSISPEDMPRNRIYPVGAAQGFLMDYFKIDWKAKAQEAGAEFSFTRLLREKFKIEDDQLERFLKKTKKNYVYEKILASTDELIQEYLAGYNREWELFEAQLGYRMEIDLSSRNLNRSRSSRAKKWVIDRGTRELCSHYNIYVLKSDILLLQVHNSGLFEQNDWEAKRKKVVFFVPKINSIFINGDSLTLAEGQLYHFKDIQILGDNLKLNYSKAGTIEIAEHRMKIDLNP